MNNRRRGRIGKGDEISEVLSPLFSSYWLFKEKRKVKSNLFDFGEKLPNNPSSSPNYPY